MWLRDTPNHLVSGAKCEFSETCETLNVLAGQPLVEKDRLSCAKMREEVFGQSNVETDSDCNCPERV